MVDHDDDDAGCWADFIGRARHIFEKGRRGLVDQSLWETAADMGFCKYPPFE